MTTSHAPRCERISASASERAATASTRGVGSPASAMAAAAARPATSRKRTFLPIESTRATRPAGSATANGSPGIPPPLPRSRIDGDRGASRRSSATPDRLSRKCSRATPSGSRTAVRLMAAVHARSRRLCASSARRAPGEGSRPSAASPRASSAAHASPRGGSDHGSSGRGARAAGSGRSKGTGRSGRPVGVVTRQAWHKRKGAGTRSKVTRGRRRSPPRSVLARRRLGSHRPMAPVFRRRLGQRSRFPGIPRGRRYPSSGIRSARSGDDRRAGG